MSLIRSISNPEGIYAWVNGYGMLEICSEQVEHYTSCPYEDFREFVIRWDKNFLD